MQTNAERVVRGFTGIDSKTAGDQRLQVQSLVLSGDCPFQGSPEALYIFPYAAKRCTSF
jgi:hypothetical protein